MKHDEFLNAMSYVDEDLIEKADEAPKKAQWPKVLAAAACLALVVLASVWLLGKPPATQAPTMQTPTTGENVQVNIPTDTTTLCYLTMDVNPSIQFAVEDGKVVACIALNDDAEPILEDLELEGLTVEEAVPLVLEALIEEGYLANENYAPVLLLAAHGGDASVEVLEKATQAAQESLVEQEVASFVVSQQVVNPETVEKLAKQYGVSVGKMQYALNLVNEENGENLSELTGSTIVELFGMDIEKKLVEPRYKVGEYDEYGEKVLYVGYSEGMNGYTPWEDLEEWYKETLYLLYSPADIEIMKQPRVWTTVPNVVGLTEAEARALMNSRNIPVRVSYYDDPLCREQGIEYGICYRQDVSPGMRWHSDAQVTLMVRGTKEQVEAQKERWKLKWDLEYLYGVISEEEYRRFRG